MTSNSNQVEDDSILIEKLEEFSQTHMSALRMEMFKEKEERERQLEADTPEILEENGQIISMLKVSQSKMTSYGKFEVIFSRCKLK
jgi:hypothetical protein